MYKKEILFSGLFLVGMFFSGCTGQQPSLPTCEQSEVIDQKSRIAIAALIGSLNELEANQNRQSEQIRLMQSEKNGMQAKSTLREAPILETPSKKETPHLLSSKTYSIKYIAKENVNVRYCGEKTCKIKDVFLKGHVFLGEEPLEDGWIETKEHMYVYSDYAKKVKN